MRAITLIIAAAVALSGCGDQQHQNAMDGLVLQYIKAYGDAPGAKKCLSPKQLDGRWFTLCGMYTGGPVLANAGLWEIRTEGGEWVALASNGRAIESQRRFSDTKIKPPELPPQFDVGKALAMFD